MGSDPSRRPWSPALAFAGFEAGGAVGELAWPVRRRQQHLSMDRSCTLAMQKGMREAGLFSRLFAIFFLLDLTQRQTFEDQGLWLWVGEPSQSWWGSQMRGSLGTDRSCQADQRPVCNPALPPMFCGRQGFHPARGPVAGRLGPSSACGGRGSLTEQRGGSGRGGRGCPQQPRASGLQQGRHLFQPGPQAQPVFQFILAAIPHWTT